MLKGLYRLLAVVVCSVFIIGTASAFPERQSARERIAMGKKVSVSRIIKSGDARLMFDEGYTKG